MKLKYQKILVSVGIFLSILILTCYIFPVIAEDGPNAYIRNSLFFYPQEVLLYYGLVSYESDSIILSSALSRSVAIVGWILISVVFGFCFYRIKTS